MKRRTLAAPIAVAYLGSVVLANWLTTHYGFIDVGFGEMATAGTFAAGGALVVRDFLQDAVGRLGVAALIIIGAGLSYLVADPFIAKASGCAFLVSEALDMVVYTPLRKRAKRFGDVRWALAVTVAMVFGAVADTVVFLWVAFGRAAVMPALPGQLIGKAEVAAALIALGMVSGRAVLRQPVNTEGA